MLTLKWLDARALVCKVQARFEEHTASSNEDVVGDRVQSIFVCTFPAAAWNWANKDLLFAGVVVAIGVAVYAIAGFLRRRLFPRVPRTAETASASMTDASRRDHR